MSKLGHQFSLDAFKGFHRRLGRAHYEPEVVEHLVFKDEKGTSIVCAKNMRESVKKGRGAVGIPFEAAVYALSQTEKECDLEGKPIPAKS